MAVLVTRHFLFLHIPKTGGSFISSLCEQHLPADWIVSRELGLHARFDQIPPRFEHLPALCLVRNPWDWYVSWFHFSVQNPPPAGGNWRWRSLLAEGRASFPEAVTRACSIDELPPLPATAGAGPRWARVMRELDCDYYTAMFSILTSPGMESGRLEVGRFESLRQDLLGFLERHSVPVPESLRAAVTSEPPVLPSGRGAYQGYYDEQLRELVARRSPLVREYGYEFEPAGAPAR